MKRRRSDQRSDADAHDLTAVLEVVDASEAQLRRADEQLATMTEQMRAATRELQDLRRELRRNADRAESLLESLNAVLSLVPLPLLVVDDELRVLVLTPHAARLLGTDGRDIEGCRLDELGMRDSVAAIGRAADEAWSNGNSNGHGRKVTLTVDTPQGRKVHCRATVSSVPLASERRVMLVLEELRRRRTTG